MGAPSPNHEWIRSDQLRIHESFSSLRLNQWLSRNRYRHDTAGLPNFHIRYIARATSPPCTASHRSKGGSRWCSLDRSTLNEKSIQASRSFLPRPSSSCTFTEHWWRKRLRVARYFTRRASILAPIFRFCRFAGFRRTHFFANYLPTYIDSAFKIVEFIKKRKNLKIEGRNCDVSCSDYITNRYVTLSKQTHITWR